MIVACPQCEGPFEVPDDRISPLCQVACPHCSFRMILDFAAANDPRLVEEGMKMASGFRTSAEYRGAVASGWSPSARPPVHIVPEERPVEPAAAAAAATPAARVPARAAEARPAAPARPAEPVRPAASTQRPRTTPPSMPATVSAPAGTVPSPPSSPDYDEEMPTIIKPSSSSQIPIASEPGVPQRVDADTESPRLRREERAAVPQPAIEQAREPAPARPEPAPPAARPAAREPLHTPPHPSQSVGADSGPMPASSSGLGSSAEMDALRPSKLGTVLLVLLVLLSLGLVIASVVLHRTPDPRPLLEELMRRGRG